MKDSMWGVGVIMLGIAAVTLIFLFQTITNTDEHNYYLLKEVTEAAMFDAVDYSAYRIKGELSIDREKFVESFVRRFAQSASLSNKYVISIYDVNETPPKVSLKVTSAVNGSTPRTGETMTFNISNKIDAILEYPY